MANLNCDPGKSEIQFPNKATLHSVGDEKNILQFNNVARFLVFTCCSRRFAFRSSGVLKRD
jgi:hypothetical protein